MEISLNSEQAKGLANFFFDIAKGLLLGGIGSAIVVPEVKLATVVITCFLSLWCLRVALTLLGEVL